MQATEHLEQLLLTGSSEAQTAVVDRLKEEVREARAQRDELRELYAQALDRYRLEIQMNNGGGTSGSLGPPEVQQLILHIQGLNQ